jgi:ABC-type dipeptide/oligopeptide/nickel transport system permease subunit
MSNLVEIDNLKVAFRQDDGSYNEAVRGVSWSLGREKLGIVGESGSGKSLTGRALLGVLPPYARIARAETLTVRSSDYIKAVQLMGASPLRIVLRHIMPLCLSSLIVRVTLDMAGIILTAAGLGFLGLGAQPPLPEWGAMIASGRRFVLDQWWVAGAPGFAILIVSLGFNLLGDGLRDALDPRSGDQ